MGEKVSLNTFSPRIAATNMTPAYHWAPYGENQHLKEERDDNSDYLLIAN